MRIERNYPIEVIYASIFQLFRHPVEEFKTTAVVEVSELEKLFTALSKECKDWQQSDGKIWYDSPEAWLRKQLNLQKKGV